MIGKVILFILEGISDYNTIAPYITELVEECKLALTVEIMRGDKTSGWLEIGGEVKKGEYEWTPSNIRQELIKRIKKHISSGAAITDLKAKEIYKIYYVTDTDDCFQQPEKEERLNKSKCMKAIFKMGKLELSPNIEVPIELIFFAKELEHITFGIEDKLTLEEKNTKAIWFAKEVDDNEGFFEYTFSKPEIKTWESFKESYVGIPTYIGKACNMNNFLDEISILRRKKLSLLDEQIGEITSKIDSFRNLKTVTAKRELDKLTRQLKNKNKEKVEIEKIIEKRENMLNTYLGLGSIAINLRE